MLSILKVQEAAFVDGAPSEKHQELIALGIGVISNRESCMQWHMEQRCWLALRNEIVDTLEVAIETGVVPAPCASDSR